MAKLSAIPIKPNEVMRLAALGCSLEEVAWYFGTTQRHIRDFFWQEFHLGSVEIHTELRKLQLDKARQGDCKMLIWLGKQMLGQREPKAEVQVSGDLQVQDLSKEELIERLMQHVSEDKAAAH